MAEGDAPYHAHIYYSHRDRATAETLRGAFVGLARAGAGEGGAPHVLFVGRMMDRGVGPHPMAQYEIHFRARALGEIVARIEASGLRALVHPLTDDDLADHTRLARWIGEPLALDESALDPPGRNQGVARFGKTDF